MAAGGAVASALAGAGGQGGDARLPDQPHVWLSACAERVAKCAISAQNFRVSMHLPEEFDSSTAGNFELNTCAGIPIRASIQNAHSRLALHRRAIARPGAVPTSTQLLPIPRLHSKNV